MASVGAVGGCWEPQMGCCTCSCKWLDVVAILKDDVVKMVKQIDIRVGGFVIFLVEQVAPALLPF